MDPAFEFGFPPSERVVLCILPLGLHLEEAKDVKVTLSLVEKVVRILFVAGTGGPVEARQELRFDEVGSGSADEVEVAEDEEESRGINSDVLVDGNVLAERVPDLLEDEMDEFGGEEGHLRV